MEDFSKLSVGTTVAFVPCDRSGIILEGIIEEVMSTQGTVDRYCYHVKVTKPTPKEGETQGYFVTLIEYVVSRGSPYEDYDRAMGILG